eukprot:symbB.v1.2.036726.t1/scaffold5249.1/size29370/2
MRVDYVPLVYSITRQRAATMPSSVGFATTTTRSLVESDSQRLQLQLVTVILGVEAKSRKKKKPEGEGPTPEEGGKQKKTRAREGGGDADFAKRRRNGTSTAEPELDDIGNSKPSWIQPGEESYPYPCSRRPPPAYGGVDPFAWQPPRDPRDPYYR